MANSEKNQGPRSQSSHTTYYHYEPKKPVEAVTFRLTEPYVPKRAPGGSLKSYLNLTNKNDQETAQSVEETTVLAVV